MSHTKAQTWVSRLAIPRQVHSSAAAKHRSKSSSALASTERRAWGPWGSAGLRPTNREHPPDTRALRAQRQHTPRSTWSEGIQGTHAPTKTHGNHGPWLASGLPFASPRRVRGPSQLTPAGSSSRPTGVSGPLLHLHEDREVEQPQVGFGGFSPLSVPKVTSPTPGGSLHLTCPAGTPPGVPCPALPPGYRMHISNHLKGNPDSPLQPAPHIRFAQVLRPSVKRGSSVLFPSQPRARRELRTRRKVTLTHLPRGASGTKPPARPCRPHRPPGLRSRPATPPPAAPSPHPPDSRGSLAGGEYRPSSPADPRRPSAAPGREVPALTPPPQPGLAGSGVTYPAPLRAACRCVPSPPRLRSSGHVCLRALDWAS